MTVLSKLAIGIVVGLGVGVDVVLANSANSANSGSGRGSYSESLVPEQDILLLASGSASEPLKFLGANSPWFAGPNVNGISSDVPDGCTVEQAAYVVRHGSRFPDSGAYQEWVTLHEKIQNATFTTSSGPLSFLSTWKPVLKFPTIQIAAESITGYKEAHDLGYSLRVRYPDFYEEGTPFNVWSNLYTGLTSRVVSTAKMFVRGYLGAASSTLGTVATVNSTGSPEAVGDSLSPSDLCPLFSDDSGGSNSTEWKDIYLPPIVDKINSMISGNLTFDENDVSIFPYLCGFESQITGKLSPWCNIFNNTELQQYEYAQDLRYYYGLGPGTSLEQLMMVPYLNSLIGVLNEGPGVTGTLANGSEFELPKLIMNFLNDGQIAELVAALGVMDDQEELPSDRMPEDRLYVTSHFVSMRGTVAFERLSCVVDSSSNSSTSGNFTQTSKLNLASTATSLTNSTTTQPFIRILLNDVVYPITKCRNGPGSSCAMEEYVNLLAERYEASGNWADNCNVTGAEAGTVVKGASFLRDLGLDWVKVIGA